MRIGSTARLRRRSAGRRYPPTTTSTVCRCRAIRRRAWRTGPAVPLGDRPKDRRESVLPEDPVHLGAARGVDPLRIRRPSGSVTPPSTSRFPLHVTHDPLPVPRPDQSSPLGSGSHRRQQKSVPPKPGRRTDHPPVPGSPARGPPRVVPVDGGGAPAVRSVRSSKGIPGARSAPDRHFDSWPNQWSIHDAGLSPARIARQRRCGKVARL